MSDTNPPGSIWNPRPGDEAIFGRTAIILVETILHGLVARSVLTIPDAVELVRAASDVHRELAAEEGDDPERSKRIEVLLDQIASSLESDLISSR